MALLAQTIDELGAWAKGVVTTRASSADIHCFASLSQQSRNTIDKKSDGRDSTIAVSILESESGQRNELIRRARIPTITSLGLEIAFGDLSHPDRFSDKSRSVSVLFFVKKRVQS